MKKISLKNIFTIVAILALFVSVNSCKQPTNKAVETEKDSVVVTEDDNSIADLEKLIINRTEMTFADPENPTDFELKHTPEITIGEMDEQGIAQITVIVGSEGIIHPEIAEHWIDFMGYPRKVGLVPRLSSWFNNSSSLRTLCRFPTLRG